MHLPHGRIGEELRRASGNAQPVEDIGARIRLVERQEVITGGDPLRELTQILPSEQRDELGLADEHDLEELLLLRLEIGEQAQLLQ